MMAAEGKKEFKAELDVCPLCEMKPKESKELKGHKVLGREIKNLKFSEKVELDPRKWTQKTLDQGVYGAVRYLFQKFSVRISSMMDEKGWESDPKFALKVIKELKGFDKEVKDTLSLAVEELAKGTGEAKKMVADFMKKIVGLDDVDAKKVFGEPRKAIIDAYKMLDRALKSEGKSGKEFEQAMADGAFTKPLTTAQDAVSKAQYTYIKNGGEAKGAIDEAVKLANAAKKNKEAIPEIVTFANDVLKTEREFLKFVDDTKTFESEIAAAIAELKAAKMKDTDAAQRVKKFESMVSLDASADNVIKLAKDWKKALGKIPVK
jgi:hypothetical protein